MSSLNVFKLVGMVHLLCEWLSWSSSADSRVQIQNRFNRFTLVHVSEPEYLFAGSASNATGLRRISTNFHATSFALCFKSCYGFVMNLYPDSRQPATATNCLSNLSHIENFSEAHWLESGPLVQNLQHSKGFKIAVDELLMTAQILRVQCDPLPCLIRDLRIARASAPLT